MGRDRLGPLFDVEAISIQTIYERALEGQIRSKQVSVALMPEYKKRWRGSNRVLYFYHEPLRVP